MPVEITDLDQLDPVDVQNIQAELTQRLQENQDGIDSKRGPIHDLILYLEAVIKAENAENAERLQRSMSLQAIEADPTLADDDIVNAVLSNYRVDRREGSVATGDVVIVVSEFRNTTIGVGSIFESGDKLFETPTSFTARTEAVNVTAANDRLLTPLADGNYGFTITVNAQEEGAESELSKDTLLFPQTPPLNFVRAVAAEDFTNGASTETNAELLTRLQEGIAAKTQSGRTTMNAFIKEEEQFPGIVTTSIIGYGDPEQLRDQHTIFPGSVGGGRVDWYVRTQQKAQKKLFTKTATLVEKGVDERGTWQILFTRDESPAMYKVSRIVLSGADATTAGTYEITEDTRFLDLTAVEGIDINPDIVDLEEGIYSRYQYASIKFRDPDTDVSGMAIGDTQDYSVTTVSMPQIDEIQLTAGGRSSRNPSGDVLVKAPIPAFVYLSFDILLKKGQTNPDTGAIADALAETVNTMGFTGRLPSSILCDTIHDFLEAPASLSEIVMDVFIRKPDGVTLYLNDSEVVEIPDLPGEMVTGRTTAFILDPDDVAISIKTADLPDI